MEEPKYNPNEKPKNSDNSESTDKPLMENIFAQLDDKPEVPEQQGWLPAEWNVDKKEDDEDEEESDTDSSLPRAKAPKKGFFASYFGIDGGSERPEEPAEAQEDTAEPDAPTVEVPETTQETPIDTAPEPAPHTYEAVEVPEETMELPEPVPLLEEDSEPVLEPEPEAALPTLEAPADTVEPETTPVRTETIVVDRDPGLAVAAFAGAEILSRNRDRKLKKQIKTQEKEVKKAEENTEQLVHRVEEQEEATQKLREHLLATKEKFAEQPILKNEKTYLKTDHQPKVEATQPTPETPTFNIEKRETPVFKPESIYKAPEIISTQVEKAIEKDEPIESALEHQHEIKGESTQLPGAYSVAEVLENLQAEQHSLQTALDQTNQTTAKLAEQTSLKATTTPGLYKTAILGGFTAALVIIVFGVIAYLATH